jgi:tetratricopeptide (TPR) repeat protein
MQPLFFCHLLILVGSTWLILNTAVFAAGCEDSTEATVTHLERAGEHALWDRYADALSELEQAVAEQPDNAQVYRQRGDIYLRLGRYQQAISDFSVALKFDDQSAPSWLGRASAYRESRQYAEALADYARAIELEPQSADSYLQRAITYHRLRRFELERADWNTAISLDAEIYWLYGTLYRHRHLYNELWSDQHTALSYPPGNAKAFYQRARALRYRRAYCLAVRDYSEAIRLRSGYDEAYLGRGIVRYLLGDYAEAIEDLSISLRRREMIEAYYYRAQAYAVVDMPQQAAADIATAARLAPFDPLIAMARRRLPVAQP